jgi:DNA-binding CsgD family transcriptional regulator
VKTDAISIVEAAYNLEGDLYAWLTRLLERAAPKLDRGFGVSVNMYGPGIRPEDAVVDSRGVDPRVRAAADAYVAACPDLFHRVVMQPGPALQTPTEAVEALGAIELARLRAHYAEFLHPVGIREWFGVLAREPSGHAVFLAAGCPDTRRPTRHERAVWGRIAAHMGAGARLRRATTSPVRGDVSDGTEAVLSPSGAFAHAEAVAKSPGPREALRRAARAIDRARSKARNDDSEALELWRGLVAGRWSLVDRFDTDGRRFVVARRNDPEIGDPRELTLRERQVIAYSAMGHPLKLVAYELGLSTSTIWEHRESAMRKLGVRSNAELARLFGPLTEQGSSRER